jgi:hypothetical protein
MHFEPLNEREKIALVYPYGELGIEAENMVISSLVANQRKLGLKKIKFNNRRFSIMPAKNIHLNTIKKHLKEKNIVVCGNSAELITENMKNSTKELLQKLSMNVPLCELMKEYPDKAGAGETGHFVEILPIICFC